MISLFEKDKNQSRKEKNLFILLGIVTIFASTFSFIDAQEFDNDQINVEVVADNLEIPWEIVFVPDGIVPSELTLRIFPPSEFRS